MIVKVVAESTGGAGASRDGMQRGAPWAIPCSGKGSFFSPFSGLSREPLYEVRLQNARDFFHTWDPIPQDLPCKRTGFPVRSSPVPPQHPYQRCVQPLPMWRHTERREGPECRRSFPLRLRQQVPASRIARRNGPDKPAWIGRIRLRALDRKSVV